MRRWVALTYKGRAVLGSGANISIREVDEQCWEDETHQAMELEGKGSLGHCCNVNVQIKELKKCGGTIAKRF